MLLRITLATLSLVLLCSRAGADEPIALVLSDPAPLPKELHAFNSNLLMSTALHGLSYGSREFKKGITDLQPGGLRFPGGTTANNYLWQEDSFSLQEDDKTKWAAQQLEIFRKIGRKYDLPGFAKLCREQKLTPIYVLNVYEERPEDIPAMFDRFEELGLEIKAIEMGNEPYWDPRSLMNVWKYMDYCRPLAEAIRKHRPDVKIGACFGPLRKDDTYAEKWNAPLAKQHWYDAIVYHEYYGGQGFALEAGVELPLETVLHPEALIDEPVEYFAELLPGKPIWFTEWNIGQKGLDQWKNRGAELLFIAAAVTRILEHRDAFEWSCFHQIYEAKFGTFFYDKQTGIQTLPSYELFRMIGAAWSDAEALHTLASGDKRHPIGFATAHGNDRSYFLVNRTEAAQTIHLPESATALTGLTIDAEPGDALPVSSGISRALEVEEGTATLAPWSINLIAPPAVIEAATRRELKESSDLFPTRPHLTLWYPPYARKQPRVSPDGSYEVDFSPFAGKPSAVIKLNLEGLQPAEGNRYRLSFDARSEPGIGFVARLPDPAQKEGKWIQLTPQKQPVQLDFTFDPGSNEGEVTFFFSEGAVSKGGKLHCEAFRIVQLEGEE